MIQGADLLLIGLSLLFHLNINPILSVEEILHIKDKENFAFLERGF